MLSSKTFRPLFVATLALGATSLWLVPSTARAEVAIAADLELDVPADYDLETAPAFAVRLGWQLRLPLIAFTPEVGYHHVSFGDDVTIDRGFAGARLGIGEVFRVGAYGHVGVGHATYDSVAGDVTDLTVDVGGFLDFTLLPLLDVGVHAGYGRVKADGRTSLAWLPFGVHAALIF